MAASSRHLHIGLYSVSPNNHPSCGQDAALVILTAALEKMFLSAFPNVFVVAIENMAINTKIRPYSVKSWPCSSWQSRLSRLRICPPQTTHQSLKLLLWAHIHLNSSLAAKQNSPFCPAAREMLSNASFTLSSRY
jgi:hypothetical protein